MPPPIPIIGALLAFPFLVSPMIEPFVTATRRWSYGNFPTQIAPEQVFVTLRRRRQITTEGFYEAMSQMGYDKGMADNIMSSDQFYPTPQDLVTWQAREVYEPDMIRKYGLDNEFEEIDQVPFRKAGINEEQTGNFWKAHWQHPPFNQLMEMLHRDVLDKPDGYKTAPPGSDRWRKMRQRELAAAYEWYRLVEIPPFWRNRLTEIAYNPLTRVDARRMWDMGVLDDRELLRAYLDLGYSEENATRMVTWTKVYQDYPDLVAAYKQGHMDSQEVMRKLLDYGMSEERATFLFQTKFANLAKPYRIAKERDLTKSEITRGVKKGVIDPEMALYLLERMGYDRAEAVMVMEINTNWTESPETPLEFLKGVESLRRAEGLDFDEVPPELDGPDREFRDASAELVVLADSGGDPAAIAQLTRRVEKLRRRVAATVAHSPDVPRTLRRAYEPET